MDILDLSALKMELPKEESLTKPEELEKKVKIYLLQLGELMNIMVHITWHEAHFFVRYMMPKITQFFNIQAVSNEPLGEIENF